MREQRSFPHKGRQKEPQCNRDRWIKKQSPFSSSVYSLQPGSKTARLTIQLPVGQKNFIVVTIEQERIGFLFGLMHCPPAKQSDHRRTIIGGPAEVRLCLRAKLTYFWCNCKFQSPISDNRMPSGIWAPVWLGFTKPIFFITLTVSRPKSYSSSE